MSEKVRREFAARGEKRRVLIDNHYDAKLLPEGEDNFIHAIARDITNYV